MAPGPLPPPATCPIGWQPQALAPVFYGARDRGPVDGAPVDLRLFFPSLDGAVSSAPLLEGCGRYPLILLCHGHCVGDTDHYRRWFRLPAQLARSGYVVVVPELAGVAAGIHPSVPDHPDLETLADVVAWVRTGWEHADVLMEAPATGVVGHSFGALVGARFASLGGVQAFAGLSGVWQDWPSGPTPLSGLQGPTLLVWGGAFDFFTQLPDAAWQQLPRPRHRVVFDEGLHWDYLGDTELPCRNEPAVCPGIGAATDDLVTMFFAKYLPPELGRNLFDDVPSSLEPPELSLTQEQEFYAGGHLGGFAGLGSDPSCAVTVDAETPPLVANRRTRETHSVDAPCPWVEAISVANRQPVDEKPAGYRWCDFCFPSRADG